MILNLFQIIFFKDFQILTTFVVTNIFAHFVILILHIDNTSLYCKVLLHRKPDMKSKYTFLENHPKMIKYF